MRVVVDANVAIDWFIVTPEGESYSRHLEKLLEQTNINFVVPLHFDVEVGGQLLKKTKARPDLYSRSWLNATMGVLDIMPFEITALGMNFDLLGKLSSTYNLSAYDVPYFHLARTLELPLATRDRGLIAACKAWHVPRWMPKTA